MSGMEPVHEISGIFVCALLRYVRRVGGQDAALEVMSRAGEARPPSVLEDDRTWSSVEQLDRLATAAAEVCQDHDIGRLAGEELVRWHRELGLTDFVAAAGSPGQGLLTTVDFASKMTLVASIRALRYDDCSFSGEIRWRPGHRPLAFLCSAAAAYWTAVPGLYGATGVAVHRECQARGDGRCLVDVMWDHPVAPDSAPDPASLERSQSFIERFEELQTLAAELAMAGDVATVLDRIVARAGMAIMAPRFLLAVSDDSGASRVYQHGFRHGNEAQACARRLLVDPGDSTHGEALVVRVANGSDDRGILAAVFAEGSTVTEFDRRLLSAYATHAWAALQSADNLERARRDRDTAQALLGLARELGTVANSSEVAHRLATAVIPVCGSKGASVWLWDEVEDVLRLTEAVPDRALPGEMAVIARDAVPEFVRYLDRPEPQVLDCELETGPAGDVMRIWGLRRCAVVPIVSRGRFLGIVSADFPDGRIPERTDLLGRLSGLADHAARALDNAHLLEQVRRQALLDSLTGLPNRALIEDRAVQALRRVRRTSGGAGVLFIDLDRFKQVNDSLGHSAGDDLIVEVGRRLSGMVRESDSVARLGGDEFLILLPDADTSAVAAVADKVGGAMREPFVIADRHLYVTASIGAACYPAHGRDYPTLLRLADAAMYRAKAGGRSMFVMHEPEAHRSYPQLDLETSLHGALERGEIEVVYQPQLEVHSGAVVGVEALMRWNHSTRGQLGPDAFLDVAEESGVITELDRWVREVAVDAVSGLTGTDGEGLRLALNLSTRDLRRAELPTEISELIRRSGFEPGRLELEVTDRVVMDEEELPRVLAALKSLGVRLAIDDFGTGTSVISRLRRCPVDTLKIDRSFVSEISRTSTEARVVTALTLMARGLGMTVVAEGVETRDQLALLRELGCDLVQGFYVGRPMTAADLRALLTEQRVAALAGL